MATGEWGSPSGERLSAAEVRERVLRVATDLTQQQGLTVSLEHLTLEVLIREAAVPRSSVFRIWKSRYDLYADLLERLASPPDGVGGAFDPEVPRIVQRTFEESRELMNTSEGRRRVFQEVIRLGAEHNFHELEGSKMWSTYVALLATYTSLPKEEDRNRVLTALQKSEYQFVAAMADLYSQALEQLGYRLREGVDTTLVAALGAAVVEGLVQRAIVNPDVVNRYIPGPALDGGVANWHPAAIGFLGIVAGLIEEAPA